ncbi:unnamed protein product [Caenorhabditis angaria]|uniref:Cytochrome P450 n=1 Tax=Caenorhabditis angaria TaxID=860376 RepID=A0A9P1NBD8_9PELO|nr:unnamed protein product [Caenorhabditis angaria]
MIILLISVFGFVFYVTLRQYRLYLQLKKCGLNPQFDIYGFTGLFWLDRCDSHENYGEICKKIENNTFSLMRGSRQVVVVSDVEMIHSISTKYYDCFHSRIPEIFEDCPISSETIHMFAARGERWKRLRTLTSFALSTAKLKTLFPTMDTCVSKFMEHVNKHGNDTVSIYGSHRLFQNHTSFVMVQCVYGYSGDENYSLENNQFLTCAMNAFGKFAEFKHNLWEKISFIFTSLRYFLADVSNFIMSNKSRKDFLDHLLCLISVFYLDFSTEQKNYSILKFFYEHRNNERLQENGNGKIDMKNVRVEKRVSNQEIVAQCKFISVAGFDTTANTLTLLFNFLAIFPDVQEKLYEEIRSLEDFSFETLCELPYLGFCIFETLRLYPHASPLQHRICTFDCKIEDMEFKNGFETILNPWMAHHDPLIWGNDVETFRPTRFTELTEIQKRAFMPFGVGPRQCVGMRFAILEIKTTVFRILQEYSVHCNDKTRLDVRMTTRDTGTIWPDADLGFILKRRN